MTYDSIFYKSLLVRGDSNRTGVQGSQWGVNGAPEWVFKGLLNPLRVFTGCPCVFLRPFWTSEVSFCVSLGNLGLKGHSEPLKRLFWSFWAELWPLRVLLSLIRVTLNLLGDIVSLLSTSSISSRTPSLLLLYLRHCSSYICIQSCQV